MKEFWNSRYGTGDYAYGTEPNEFFKDQILHVKKGKILFPAEGEGRNAVHAALLGFDVHAFDPSKEGRKKALMLAEKRKVTLQYGIDSYDSVNYPNESFDAVVLIFAHMPSAKRKEWHRRLSGFLKPGGTLIIEGFSKEQLQFGTGGPPDIDMLFTMEELTDDFHDLTPAHIEKTIVSLNEGPYHQGDASVIRAVFVK